METHHKRSAFSGKLGFVLSAAGASVGLGNIWRFPYLAAKYGGGIFLLIYILLAVTFGYTMIIAETALGRMTRKSPVGAYSHFGKGKGLAFGGWINAVIPILIVPYYSVIGGWVIHYLAQYLTGHGSALASDGYFSGFISNGLLAEISFLLFAFITLGIIFAGVRNGVERVSKVMMPILVVLSVIIAHTVLGPIGWKIGTFISDIVYAGISGSFRVVFGAIFGFVYAPLVITGLHHMSNAIDMQLIADFGGTMLWPMIALSNIAQGSAVLGMIYLQRKNAAAQEVNVPSCISCYLGVTEPAMFGVNLKFHFPFICGMIGSAIAAVVCVATSTTANAIGVGGIPGILSIQPAYMLSFALCMAIAIVVPFVLTVIVGKKKGVA